MQLCDIDTRRQLLNSELERIVTLLKSEYNPEKIILFGSMATGNIHEWSDIDLFIIKETDKRPIDRCIEICKLISPKIGIDLFVYTPKEYDTLLKEKYSFIKQIQKHGKILYEKRN